jgi:hypothetical protein
MGLMDKVKAQAEQAMTKAQAGVAQGQAKLEERQQGRTHADLLRNLGAAVWAERREGRGSAAVDEALAALDAYNAANPAPAAPSGQPAPTTDAAGAPTVAPPAGGGDFKL